MVIIQIGQMIVMILMIIILIFSHHDDDDDDDDITRTVIILTLSPRRLCRALLNLRKYTDALVYGAKQYGPSQVSY